MNQSNLTIMAFVALHKTSFTAQGEAPGFITSAVCLEVEP
jgi:hypothetical protein